MGAQGARTSLQQHCPANLLFSATAVVMRGARGSLLPCGWLTALQTLTLHNNGIGDEGRKGLAPALQQLLLTNMTLHNNSIDEGRKGLAPALQQPALQTLTLNSNSIGGDEGARHHRSPTAQLLPCNPGSGRQQHW
jgi:hypothetical protein